MNVKKILFGAIISTAVCFSACSDGNSEITETSAESITAAEETISAESETETATAAEQSDNFMLCGNGYSSEDIYIEIDGNALTETDMGNIRRMKKLSAVSIENPSVPLVEMFSENPLVTKIELCNFDGDISEYIDLLKSFDIVVINAVKYSGKDSALIYSELSDAFVRYEKNSDRLFDLPTEGIALAVPAVILSRGSDGFDTWNAPIGELTVGISNFTDKKQTVCRLEIFYESENGDEVAVFRNGDSFLEFDAAAAPLGEAAFTVDDTVFDYKSAANGVYKVRVTFENDTAEAEFVIANSDGLEFLTAEQRELFD
ncbi:MAG: hypothetical protein K2N26_03255, partial [Oscillospiraceae bacterium]|nr:hypothetical protein [Oscillospiraceae bacterium]